jgi:hypothetical protein
VAVGWYAANATGDPKTTNGTWYADVARSVDGAATWTVANASGTPVKVGALCPQGAACTKDRELLDYVGLAYAPDGKLVFAFCRSRDVGGAKAGLVDVAVSD